MSLTYSEKSGLPSTNPSSFGSQNPSRGVPRYGPSGERLEDYHPPGKVPRYGLNGERLDDYPPGTYPCCFGPNGERLHDYHPPGTVPESTPVELKKSGFSSALNSLISLRNYQHIREMAAEFLATMVFVAFGNGATAQVLLGFNLFGEWLSVAIGYGFGILFGYLSKYLIFKLLHLRWDLWRAYESRSDISYGCMEKVSMVESSWLHVGSACWRFRWSLLGLGRLL